MTLASKDIYHLGFVHSIEDGIIHVSVETQGECKACSVKSSCGISDDNEKLVSVKLKDSSFEIGEEVALSYDESLEFKSVFLVYVLPIFIGLIAMLIIHHVFANELLTGFSLLAIFAIYFLVLKAFNKLIKSTFSFSISKVSAKHHEND